VFVHKISLSSTSSRARSSGSQHQLASEVQRLSNEENVVADMQDTLKSSNHMGRAIKERSALARTWLVPHGDERLQTASTCFNLFKLPDYSSKALLEERELLLVMHVHVRTAADVHACLHM
jgi:hypothetical protein